MKMIIVKLADRIPALREKHRFFRSAAHFIAAEKEGQITIFYTIKLYGILL